MGKSRNPGYQGGNNWGICDRCGQAYRQTELVDQHDGLRVCVHDCYDKRHPQEAVRDKGWECGGDGAQGTGLDWNGAGRLARPDVDPLSFIQEPNDDYFTTIPEGTFGQGSLLWVPDAPNFGCCEAGSWIEGEYPDPIGWWWTATNAQEWFGGAHQNGLNTAVDGGRYGGLLNTCYYGGSCAGVSPAQTISGTVNPQWRTNSAYSKDGDAWPAFRFDSAAVNGLGRSAYWASPTSFSTYNPFAGYEYITWILVIGNVQDVNQTIITTQLGSFDGVQRDEGIRSYSYNGETYLGFRLPAGSDKHPDSLPYSCEGCYTPGEDMDMLGVPLNTDTPTIVEFHWEPNQLKIVKDGERTVFDGTIERYWPNGFTPNRYSDATFDFYDLMCIYPTDGQKLSRTYFKKLTDALAWKYNIPVKKNI